MFEAIAAGAVLGCSSYVLPFGLSSNCDYTYSWSLRLSVGVLLFSIAAGFPLLGPARSNLRSCCHSAGSFCAPADPADPAASEAAARAAARCCVSTVPAPATKQESEQ